MNHDIYIKVKTLMPFNTEPHVWQSKPSDIISVDKADIIIYNGGDLDHWFEEDILPSIDIDPEPNSSGSLGRANSLNNMVVLNSSPASITM